MTPYELIKIALGIGSRLDVQWGLFITVHLALFGGIIYVDRALWLFEKVAAIFLYSGFAYLNYQSMMAQTALLEQSYLQIASFSQNPCCKIIYSLYI